jgi:hypothetical protein
MYLTVQLNKLNATSAAGNGRKIRTLAGDAHNIEVNEEINSKNNHR